MVAANSTSSGSNDAVESQTLATPIGDRQRRMAKMSVGSVMRTFGAEEGSEPSCVVREGRTAFRAEPNREIEITNQSAAEVLSEGDQTRAASR